MGPRWPFNLRPLRVGLGNAFPPCCRLPSSVVCRWGVGIPPASDQTTRLFSAATPKHTHRQAAQLKLELCRRLPRCPQVVPTHGTARGVWIRTGLAAGSPVWLYAESGPSWVGTHPLAWPPSRLIRAASWPAPCFLLLECQTAACSNSRKALGRVGLSASPNPAPGVGLRRCGAWARHSRHGSSASPTVSRSGPRCWAGIAHRHQDTPDRLRLRLSLRCRLQGCRPEDGSNGKQDLDDLEAEITARFLVFAGGGSRRAGRGVPLHRSPSELAARSTASPSIWIWPPLTASIQRLPWAGPRPISVRPNARSYGQPPVLLRLLPAEGWLSSCRIWDRGPGIAMRPSVPRR